MLSYSKLPKSFLGKAMMIVFDLLTFSLSASLNADVPKKFLTSIDVSYKYLKVFGCRDFVCVPKYERSKLDFKSKKCILLGYGNEELRY